MNSQTYHATANGIDQTFVTIRDLKTSPYVNRLVTRNNIFLKELGVHDFPFQHRDENTGDLQVYDVLAQTAVVININQIDDIVYHSLPEWFVPSAITYRTDLVDGYELLNIAQPFIYEIKTAYEYNSFYNNEVLSEEAELKIYRFWNDTNRYKLKIRDVKMYSFLHSLFHRRCNKALLDYINKNYEYVLLVPYLEQFEGIPKFETIEDIKEFTEQKEVLITAQKKRLEKEAAIQIKKYEEEFKLLCEEKFAGDEFKQERDFLQLQYTKAIEDIRKLNFDILLSVYQDNPFLLLRYWPVEFDQPKTNSDVVYLSHYENTIFQSLYVNGIAVSKEQISFINVLVNNSFLVDQLNNCYLQPLKQIRIKQIRDHAEKIAATVREEIQDLDEEDINDILSSIQDYDSFQERIDEIDTIAGILQYWPSILLPAPDHIRRLGTVTQEMLDMCKTSV